MIYIYLLSNDCYYHEKIISKSCVEGKSFSEDDKYPYPCEITGEKALLRFTSLEMLGIII